MFYHHYTGALLLSDQVFHKEHYLFWGDSDICIATTENLIHYTNTVRQPLLAIFFFAVQCVACR